MTGRKVHPDQLHSDVELVHRLVNAQFPQWSDLEIIPVDSTGTESYIYRLGDKLAIRMPLLPVDDVQVSKLHHWLPQLAPHLPLKVPLIKALGQPDETFPAPWAVIDWIEGEEVTFRGLKDPIEAARSLAEFCRSLVSIDPTGGPSPGRHNFYRGIPLAARNKMTQRAIDACGELFEIDLLRDAWQRDMNAPAWDRQPAWLHGDIAPDNLLQTRGDLAAVIDWGGMAIGDPAAELLPAWNLFHGESRQVYRQAIGLDDATWFRGRGLALSIAIVSLPYYLETIPTRAANSRAIIEDILRDQETD